MKNGCDTCGSNDTEHTAPDGCAYLPDEATDTAGSADQDRIPTTAAQQPSISRSHVGGSATKETVGMTYGVRYKDGNITPATNRAQAQRVASNLGGRVVLVLDVSVYDDEANLPALRELGPDVGEPDDAQTVAYVSEELQRRVMEAVARYPASGVGPDGKVHGLAAVAAIKAIEDWLLP